MHVHDPQLLGAAGAKVGAQVGQRQVEHAMSSESSRGGSASTANPTNSRRPALAVGDVTGVCVVMFW